MKPAGWKVEGASEHHQAGEVGRGRGNHFLEVCADDEGVVWVVLHSGSRNIGKELAEFHIEQAQKLAHNQDLPDRNLAVFIGTHPSPSERPAQPSVNGSMSTSTMT